MLDTVVTETKQTQYDYRETLAASQRVNWRIRRWNERRANQRCRGRASRNRRFLDAGLKQQTFFDLEAFERATGRHLSEAEREDFRRVQHQANRWTYLGSRLTHQKFLETIGKLSPAQRKRIEETAPIFC